MMNTQEKATDLNKVVYDKIVAINPVEIKNIVNAISSLISFPLTPGTKSLLEYIFLFLVLFSCLSGNSLYNLFKSLIVGHLAYKLYAHIISIAFKLFYLHIQSGVNI